MSLGGALLHRSSGPPGARMKRAVSCACLALLRLGVAWQPCYHDPGGLLHHHFTLAKGDLWRFVSVALFQKITSLRVLPGSLLCGVRTFLDVPKHSAITQPTWKCSSL